MIDVTGRSSGLLPVKHLPIPNEQWSEDSTVFIAAYSYGDSAGFTPASHFNSAVAETNYVGKSREDIFLTKTFY